MEVKSVIVNNEVFSEIFKLCINLHNEDNIDYREEVKQIVEIIKINALPLNENHYKQFKKKLDKKYLLVEKSELNEFQLECLKIYIQQLNYIFTLNNYIEEKEDEMTNNFVNTIITKLNLLVGESDKLFYNLIDINVIKFTQ